MEQTSTAENFATVAAVGEPEPEPTPTPEPNPEPPTPEPAQIEAD